MLVLFLVTWKTFLVRGGSNELRDNKIKRIHKKEKRILLRIWDSLFFFVFSMYDYDLLASNALAVIKPSAKPPK